MKRILCVCMMLGCLMYALPASAADRTIFDAEGESVVLRQSSKPGFFHFDSERSAFSIDIPAVFTKEVSIEDDDFGKTYSRFILSDDSGKAKFSFSCSRLAGPLTIDQFFKSECQDLLDAKIKPAYEKLGKDFFVLSWLDEGVIYYKKVMLDADTLGHLNISYPAERKKEFDPLVTHSANSLKLSPPQ